MPHDVPRRHLCPFASYKTSLHSPPLKLGSLLRIALYFYRWSPDSAVRPPFSRDQPITSLLKRGRPNTFRLTEWVWAQNFRRSGRAEDSRSFLSGPPHFVALNRTSSSQLFCSETWHLHPFRHFLGVISPGCQKNDTAAPCTQPSYT